MPPPVDRALRARQIHRKAAHLRQTDPSHAALSTLEKLDPHGEALEFLMSAGDADAEEDQEEEEEEEEEAWLPSWDDPGRFKGYLNSTFAKWVGEYQQARAEEEGGVDIINNAGDISPDGSRDASPAPGCAPHAANGALDDSPDDNSTVMDTPQPAGSNENGKDKNTDQQTQLHVAKATGSTGDEHGHAPSSAASTYTPEAEEEEEEGEECEEEEEGKDSPGDNQNVDQAIFNGNQHKTALQAPQDTPAITTHISKSDVDQPTIQSLWGMVEGLSVASNNPTAAPGITPGGGAGQISDGSASLHDEGEALEDELGLGLGRKKEEDLADEEGRI